MMVEHVLSVRKRRIRIHPSYAVAGGTEEKQTATDVWEEGQGA